MALSDDVKVSRPRRAPGVPPLNEMVPMSVLSNWVDLCDEPETADNAGNAVVNPGAITRASQRKLDTEGFGTTLQIRLKYDDGVTGVTSPVIQAFGEDGNGNWQKLFDRNGSHELTLTVAASTDVKDADFCYTNPVEVDMDGCKKVLIAVKTAFNATGTINTSVIQAKIK